MKDTLITFETAKLAKEKGFTEITFKKRASNGELCRLDIFPTQSLLQKWLRDKKALIVSVNNETFTVTSENGWYYTIRDYSSHQKFLRGKSKTYEQALEKGLQEALKLING